MYRVVLPVVLALSISGCSLGSSSISSGLADNPPTSAALKRRDATALGGEPAVDRTSPAVAGARMASLDQAPKGSFERAPSGALSDRDYTQTKLEAERARDLINAYRKATIRRISPSGIAFLIMAPTVPIRGIASSVAAIMPSLPLRTSELAKPTSRKYSRAGRKAPDTTRTFSCPMRSTWALPSCKSLNRNSRRSGRLLSERRCN